MDIIRGSITNPIASPKLVEELNELRLDGTLYLGYPILSTVDNKIFVDAMLVSEQFGIIIFYFPDCSSSDPEFWTNIEQSADDIYIAITQKLRAYKELRDGRELAVKPNIVAYLSYPINIPANKKGLLVHKEIIRDYLSTIPSFPKNYFKPLNAALQRVTRLKPINKRTTVVKRDSKGAIIKKIEKEIANLDKWQSDAAIESPEGPQCIRGLAGSGKTIVLALKAAFLHAQHPEWTIAVTFHTRSLYQQFEDLIRKFSYDQIEDEPDWSRLKILHSWGSRTEPGIYSEIALEYGIQPVAFGEAKDLFGSRVAFSGICEKLLAEIGAQESKNLYDVLLIDEAQDFPRSFFQLVAQKAVKEPHRIVYAYDELQNLGDYAISSPEEMFGVQLHNVAGGAKQDIVLPICYRNTPWALTVAHSIGFGIYRKEGLVQLFHDSNEAVWKRLGYTLLKGTIEPSHRVALTRSKESAPDYFFNLIKDTQSIETKIFDNVEEQATWVANQIEENLKPDELEPGDILVIFPNPLSVTKDAGILREKLRLKKLSSHIAGVTSSRDKLFLKDSIAITGIFRAKGNEAPMVYVLNSEYGEEGSELIKKRNTIFTAITRSKAWVRICGCGPAMEKLKAEIDEVIKRDYQLEFTVPTEEQLAQMKKIYREITTEDRSNIEKLKEVVTLWEKGDLPIEVLPKKLRERLKKQLEQLKEQ